MVLILKVATILVIFIVRSTHTSDVIALKVQIELCLYAETMRGAHTQDAGNAGRRYARNIKTALSLLQMCVFHV